MGKTLRVGTSKNIDNEDDEKNASEPENQESEIQDNPFRPSNMNKLRTPMQPLIKQNIDLNDSVVIYEDRTGEDYHKGVQSDFSSTRHIRRSVQCLVTLQKDNIDTLKCN